MELAERARVGRVASRPSLGRHVRHRNGEGTRGATGRGRGPEYCLIRPASRPTVNEIEPFWADSRGLSLRAPSRSLPSITVMDQEGVVQKWRAEMHPVYPKTVPLRPDGSPPGPVERRIRGSFANEGSRRQIVRAVTGFE